jgi:hypothetical protein
VTATLTAELAEIRERHADDVEMYTEMPGLSGPATDRLVADRAALLAHIDALTAELASVRAERLLLARGWAEDIDVQAPRLPLNEFLRARDVARRIVVTAEREEVERGG